MQELDTIYQPFKKELLNILENDYKLSFDLSIIDKKKPLSLQGTIYIDNHKLIEFNTIEYREKINYTFGSKTVLWLLFEKVIEKNFKNKADSSKRTMMGLYDWFWTSLYERHICLNENILVIVFPPNEYEHKINLQPENVDALGKVIQYIEISDRHKILFQETIEELDEKNVPCYQVVNKFWDKDYVI
jgi:hypothetical protein